MTKSDAVEFTEREQKSTKRVTRFVVTVTRGTAKGKSCEIGEHTPGPVRVGTSASCDLPLTDRRVSRHHLSLDWQEGGLRLTDQRSTNGTRVNGVAVFDALLSGGERIDLGETELVVSVPDAPDAEPRRPEKRDKFGRFIGSSPAMQRLYPLFERLAAGVLPVLVEGETGTGKELLAETLHENGPRAGSPFVALEVAGAGGAFEVELFGGQATPGEELSGAFLEARGGTLLLTGIEELPLGLQARLLRRVEAVSLGTTPLVRLIVTSRKRLEREVENGNFREDLYYRLAVARVELPSLRSREGDVPLLAEHFWRQMVRDGSPGPADLLQHVDGYHFPGNVRELRNLVARRLAVGAGEAKLAPGSSGERNPSEIFERVVALDLSYSEARARVISEFERYFVGKLLERFNGNVTRAAVASGIARRYFRTLKARHGR